MAFLDFLPAILLGITVAIGPFLAFAVHRNRGNRTLWKAFLFGWGGWFLALIARLIPLQVPALFLAGSLGTDLGIYLAYIAYASILAGVFEEGFRYIFLQQRSFLRKPSALIAFGLGWGLGEALIIYVPAILALPFLATEVPGVMGILPGALERNIAILAHLSLTMIICRAVSSRKKNLLWLSMALHALLNIVSVYSLTLTQNAWLSELSAFMFTALIILVSVHLTRGPSRSPKK
jgi:uncharacterized membrane protein YhfC